MLELSGLSEELKLVLRMARGELNAPLATLDGEKILKVCARHRLVNYLCQHRAAQLDFLPREARRRITEENSKIALRQLRNIEIIERLTYEFKALGMEFYIVKGAPLAQYLYGNPGARMSRDIDVLLPKKHMNTGCAIVEKMGFSPKSQATATHSSWVDENDTVVEIHDRLSIFGLGKNWFDRTGRCQAGTQVAEIAGIVYPLPNMAEYFVYLCWHGAGHGWYRLLWLVDIARLFEIPQALDYAAAMKIARRQGLEHVVGQAAYLTEKLLGAKTPPEIWISREARDMAQTALDLAITSERPLDECFDYNVNPRRELLYQIAAQGKFVNQLHFVLSPTVEDRRQMQLPQSEQWLYYFLRPILLLTRAFKKINQ